MKSLSQLIQSTSRTKSSTGILQSPLSRKAGQPARQARQQIRPPEPQQAQLSHSAYTLSLFAMELPRILILGGSGFIGRHLVMYLFKNKLASKVCVADKVLYQIAGLSKAEVAVYENADFV